MRLPPALFCVLFLFGGTVAQAQSADALPLPGGTLRLGVGGSYAQWDSRDGESLGAPYAAELTAVGFAPLGEVVSPLDAFLRGTDGLAGADPTASGAELTLGSLDLEATAKRTRVPFSAELGLTSRIAIGFGVTLEKERADITRTALLGANVGVNPDPTGNAAILAMIDSAYAALGGAAFLPDSTSALGQELLRRVAAALGTDSTGLRLPGGPALGNAALGADSLLFPELLPTLGFRPRYAEAGVRLQLLGTGPPLPTPRGVRAALSARARFPLERERGRSPLLYGSEVGITPEQEAELRADLELSSRLWLSVGGTFTRRGEGSVERLFPDPDFTSPADSALLPLQFDPGDALTAQVAPHFQLTPDLSFAALYAFEQRGADAASADVADVGLGELVGAFGGRSAQTVGFGARYSTLPGWYRSGGTLPVDVEITYRRVISGSGGVPDASVWEITGRAYQALWGSGPGIGRSPPQ
ncbi:MAG: hypothetical protein ACR2F9_08025 [Longimicrobiaceae bacterium]